MSNAKVEGRKKKKGSKRMRAATEQSEVRLCQRLDGSSEGEADGGL